MYTIFSTSSRLAEHFEDTWCLPWCAVWGQNASTCSSVTSDYCEVCPQWCFVISHVHAEKIPLFWRVKYIVNVDACWVLCGKILYPISFDSHLHAYRVRFDKHWTVLKPGDEVDHQALDVLMMLYLCSWNILCSFICWPANPLSCYSYDGCNLMRMYDGFDVNWFFQNVLINAC